MQSKNRKSDKDATHLEGFSFFTQPLARVQFKPELPFLSFFVLKSFPLVFKSEHKL